VAVGHRAATCPWRLRARRQAVLVWRGRAGQQWQFRGELAIWRGLPAQPCIRLIREDHNHDAVMRIAAKPRGGGPILQSGLETMGYGRVTATSDRHRQPL